jgi:hypothetical protein
MTDARELLQRAGWSPERRVDTDEMLRALEGAGHVVVPPARELFANCSGLTIRHDRRVMRIDGWEAVRNADTGWCADYAEGIGRAVTPIGDYSHMTIMVDESGEFWGGFDDVYGSLGHTLLDLVHGVVVAPASGRLDRILPDV